MGTEIVVQFGILIFTVASFFVLFRFPKRALSKLRSKARQNNQANRHFIQGAQFLARARSAGNKSTAQNLAKSAVDEADKALALEPRDAASHILKAMALCAMGRKTSALKSLDSALSPPAVKMLSDGEKADALVKRGELHLDLNRRRRVDMAVTDLLEAARLSPDNARAFCLLGQCYQLKGSNEQAKAAYEKALNILPTMPEARNGLAQLSS